MSVTDGSCRQTLAAQGGVPALNAERLQALHDARAKVRDNVAVDGAAIAFLGLAADLVGRDPGVEPLVDPFGDADLRGLHELASANGSQHFGELRLGVGPLAFDRDLLELALALDVATDVESDAPRRLPAPLDHASHFLFLLVCRRNFASSSAEVTPQ